MSTQTDILQRQSEAVQGLEANAARLHQFLNGAVDDTVSTASGQEIPTLRGVIAAAREQVGFRTYEIAYSVEDLLRYQNNAQALFRTLAGTKVIVPARLNGSVFALETSTGATVRFSLTFGTLSTYVIEFAAGTNEGVVIEGPEVEVEIPKGTKIVLTCTTGAYTAAGFYMTGKLRVADLE